MGILRLGTSFSTTFVGLRCRTHHHVNNLSQYPIQLLKKALIFRLCFVKLR